MSRRRKKHGQQATGYVADFKGSNNQRPFRMGFVEVALSVSGLLVIIGTILAMSSSHKIKIAAVWVFIAALIIGSVAVGVRLTHEFSESPSTSTPPLSRLIPSVTPAIVRATPSVTPSPAVTLPTPEKVSPKPTPFLSPSSSETNLTPTQIFDKIDAANALFRDDVRRAFAGLSVDWTLSFVSATTREENMRIFLRDNFRVVMCEVPLKGNERFPLMERTDRFRVKGKIEEVGILAINLKDVSIEQIHSSE
jgi:hypothetical protein